MTTILNLNDNVLTQIWNESYLFGKDVKNTNRLTNCPLGDINSENRHTIISNFIKDKLKPNKGDIYILIQKIK